MIVHPNIHPHHSDINLGPMIVCMKFQLELYSRIYGLRVIDPKGIQELKAALRVFEK